MLAQSAARILGDLGDDAVVLDVGAGASPFPRADWVIDLVPFEGRGRYGYDAADRAAERFSADRWVTRDVCDREPWPFDDDQFDFVVCSHLLEDVRDPVWVCAEMSRVARAGYVETPSRLEEQTRGVHGPWTGWSHHRWFVEVEDGELVFTFKHHVVCGRDQAWFPPEFLGTLTDAERVVPHYWIGACLARERHFGAPEELDAYLTSFVERESAARGIRGAGRPRSPRRRR